MGQLRGRLNSASTTSEPPRCFDLHAFNQHASGLATSAVCSVDDFAHPRGDVTLCKAAYVFLRLVWWCRSGLVVSTSKTSRILWGKQPGIYQLASRHDFSPPHLGNIIYHRMINVIQLYLLWIVDKWQWTETRFRAWGVFAYPVKRYCLVNRPTVVTRFACPMRNQIREEAILLRYWYSQTFWWCHEEPVMMQHVFLGRELTVLAALCYTQPLAKDPSQPYISWENTKKCRINGHVVLFETPRYCLWYFITKQCRI